MGLKRKLFIEVEREAKEIRRQKKAKEAAKEPKNQTSPRKYLSGEAFSSEEKKDSSEEKGDEKYLSGELFSEQKKDSPEEKGVIIGEVGMEIC